MSSKTDPTLDDLSGDGDESWLAEDDQNWGPESHLAEIMRLKSQSFWRGSFLQHAKESTPFALLRFALHGVTNYLTTLVLAPSSIFGDPLSTFASLVIYPVIFTGLLIVAITFWVASHTGGGLLVRWIQRTFMGGYSAPNWLDPTIFDPKNDAVITSAGKLLGGDPTTLPHSTDSTHKRTGRTPATTRLFSLPIARTFLLFSAIVYERDDNLVKKAANTLAAGDAIKAKQQYNKSHKKIKKQAKQWGLHWEAISSMSTVSGPFASCFYPKAESGAEPYIALVFKGTSAASFAEILVDANITRVPASVFYGAGATAHEGFYDELFPSNAGGPDGYSTIRSYVKALAQEMRGGRANGTGNAKIPLWVTGHSLGSALASLIFARFIQSPEDLGDDIELRDCYSYGTPRLGDGAFAASFERNLVTPIDRPNILWRVVNNFDIVCQVPPGLADSDHSRATLGLSVLNYSHIGTEVRLSPFWHPFFTINNAYFRSTTHSLLEDSMRPATAGERVSSRLASLNNAGFNPIRIALFPASYLGHLNQIDFSAQPVPSPEDEHAIGVGAGIADKERGKGHWHAASLASGH
ncbi:hypothetical protein RQP46_009704 [Phenoliferia psychrophenolica]